MKRVLAILLLVSVSCQFATKMGIIVWYKANIDYVSTVLCINKNEPEKHCNGKCYLKKQLNKVDDNTSDKQSENKKTETQLPEFVATSYFLLQKQVAPSLLNHKSFYSNFYRYRYSSSPFHPPPFSC